MTFTRCCERAGYLALICWCMALPARAQDCVRELEQAEEHYNFGRFDEAITLLDSCLKKQGVPESQREQALRLKGLSYVGKDLLTEAKDMIRQLLLIAPNYQPDPAEDPPSFVTIVDEVRQEAKVGAPAQDRMDSRQTGPSTVRDSGSPWSFPLNLITAVPVAPEAFTDFWGVGYGLGGGVGYALNDQLKVRLYLSGTAFSLDEEALLEESGLGDADLDIDGGEVLVGTFMVEGEFRLGGGRRSVMPYIVGGVGGFSLSVNEISVEGVALETEESETALGLAAGGGLTFAVKDNLRLFIEGRYVVGFTEEESTAFVPLHVGFTFGR